LLRTALGYRYRLDWRRDARVFDFIGFNFEYAQESRPFLRACSGDCGRTNNQLPRRIFHWRPIMRMLGVIVVIDGAFFA
jgi:hypothetical protein